MIFSDTYQYGFKVESSDQYQVQDRLDSVCVVASEESLNEILSLLDIDYRGVDLAGKQRLVSANMDTFMTDTMGFEPLVWQFDDTVYQFQAEAFKNIYLMGTDYIPISAEYFFWESQFKAVQAEADTIAGELGYSYTISGDLIKPSFGNVTGIVASLYNSTNNVTLSGFYPSQAVSDKAKRGVVVKEAVTNPIEITPFSHYYSLAMHEFDDKPFMPYNMGSTFNWETDSCYDFVLFLNESGQYVNFSSLTASELSLYMQNEKILKLKTADSFLKKKESSITGLHNKTWAYIRKLNAIREKLVKYREYVAFLRGIQ